MDTGKLELTNEDINDINYKEQKFREHFKHMCEAGYDPLVCVNRLHRFINPIPPGLEHGDVPEFTTKNKTQYMDRIITENRYVDLLKFGNKSIADLDDIIFIPSELVAVKFGSIIGITAAIFWLYPSGCRTLGDLYKKYEKKIKNELRRGIIT